MSNLGGKDANGIFWVYEVELLQQTNCWYENEAGKYQKIALNEQASDWQQSLTRVDQNSAIMSVALSEN